MQAVLLQRSAGARLPRDEEFRAAFVIKDIYNSPSRIRHYLLNKLENYKRKERVIIEEYTIEHILPQNPHLAPAWREALGPSWQEVQRRYLHTWSCPRKMKRVKLDTSSSVIYSPFVGFVACSNVVGLLYGKVKWNRIGLEKHSMDSKMADRASYRV